MHLVADTAEFVEPEIETEDSIGLRNTCLHVSHSGWQSRIRDLARQPLVHFLVAGILLFCAASLFEHWRASSLNEVRVSTPEIQRLRDVWSRQYGRYPDAAQMRTLIDDYIREEIYYREALASGLDKDDTIIRRRLVEKMEFLSQEVASGQPSDQELQEYFDHNHAQFQIPAKLAFSHIFFSVSKRGASTEQDAHRALAVLRQANNARSEAALGDAFMLQNEYPLQTQDEVKSLFGEEFASRLFQFDSGEWQDPIRSSYGLHLVRISQFQPAHVPQLSEVRNDVLMRFKNDRLQDSSEAYYRQLRNKYRVAIDDVELARQPSQSLPNAANNGQNSRQANTPDED